MKYKVTGKKFDRFSDAADYARAALTGMHYDDTLMIEEWQEDGAYWEPCRTAKRDRGGNPVVDRAV